MGVTLVWVHTRTHTGALGDRGAEMVGVPTHDGAVGRRAEHSGFILAELDRADACLVCLAPSWDAHAVHAVIHVSKYIHSALTPTQCTHTSTPCTIWPIALVHTIHKHQVRTHHWWTNWGPHTKSSAWRRRTWYKLQCSGLLLTHLPPHNERVGAHVENLHHAIFTAHNEECCVVVEVEAACNC